MRNSFFTLAVMLIASFFLTACDQFDHSNSSQLSNSKAINKLHLIRGQYADLTLDPLLALNNEQTSLVRDLLEGLVIYDPQGNIIPAMAQHWQTEDNKTWIFYLRENLQWSNGEKLTATDFVQSWQYLAQSDSPLRYYLAFMNLNNANAVLTKKVSVVELGVMAQDERTLIIQLDKPTPFLPKMLAHSSLLPQYLAPHSDWVGNGAYRLVSQQNKLVKLAYNPFYWNKISVQIPLVEYRQLTANQSLEGVDLLFNPTIQNEQLQYLPQLCSYFYEFNLKDPMLAKLPIRKALTSLISLKAIFADETSHILPLAYLLPQSLMADWQSNWEDVVAEQIFSQFKINENSPLQLRLSYDDNDQHRNIAHQLMRQLGQSDMLRIQGEALSWQELQAKRQRGDFQIIRSGWCADYNDISAFLIPFHSHSPDNKTGFANADVDKWLEQAMETLDEKQRLTLYNKIIQQLEQEYVLLPVFQYTQAFYLAPHIQGVNKTNPTAIVYSKDLSHKPQ